MCCESATVELPAEVAEALAQYRHLLHPPAGGQDPTWGETIRLWLPAMLTALRFRSFDELIDQAVRRVNARATDGATVTAQDDEPRGENFAEVLRDLLDYDHLPTGLAVVHVDDSDLTLVQGPARQVIPGQEVHMVVLIDSALGTSVTVDVEGTPVHVGPRSAATVDITVGYHHPEITVSSAAAHLVARVVAPRPSGLLRLVSADVVRWSVVDEDGIGWFPQGALRKWDFHERPFFHAAQAELEVPAGRITVRATRGLEYAAVQAIAEVDGSGLASVTLNPPRRFDPATAGWFGADLHVHMNYTGEFVVEPAQAAAMQFGEGLHVMSLVAGNATTSRVFDREALDAWVGGPLPWSADEAVAQMGVEYRNDLLGHFHATGPSANPGVFQTGHAHSDHPEDWPANATAAQAFQHLDAIIGYCHPVFQPLTEDGPATEVFDGRPRSDEARELVVDAALGLVDSVDVLSNANPFGSAVLYRRLLGAGRRLAVTAGTDVFLSMSRASIYSNPPGAARVYANVEGALTLTSFKDAVRAGRTMATNGPWLSLTVDDVGPGTTLDGASGRRVRAVVEVTGPGVNRVELRSAAGVVAASDIDGDGRLVMDVDVSEPTFLVAVAHGGTHPDVLQECVFAHTSPVYLNVEGRPVARREDVEWCINWIDQLQELLDRSGVFLTGDHRREVKAVMESARRVYVGALGDDLRTG